MKKDEKLEREIGVSSGSAADVEAIMRKYDRESNTRIWEGTPKIVVSCVAALCLLIWSFRKRSGEGLYVERIAEMTEKEKGIENDADGT